jgi:tetratricopeptide (TPR) repeat protein
LKLRQSLYLILGSLLLVAMVAGTTLATDSYSAEFNAAEIIGKYTEAVFPVLNQFRVTLDAYWNNQRIGYGTFGWNSGPSITGTVLSPMLNSQGAISFAFRPSGMFLIRTPDSETVMAELASEKDLIETITKVLNRDLYAGFLTLVNKGMKVVGATTYNGRPAYIIESDPSKPSVTEIMDFILNNPMFTDLFPEDVLPEDLSVFYPTEDELKLLPTLPITRSYIDMQDYLPLGFDQESLDAFWQTINSLVTEQEGMTIPQPKINIGDIVVDTEGHIAAITYSVSMDFPQSVLGLLVPGSANDESQTSEAAKMGLMFDLVLEIARNGDIYLPSYFAASATIDVSGLDVSGNAALALNPVQTHAIELVFDWDLSRGADTTLVNNSRLVTAERSWLEANALLESGDYNGAVASIERLLSVAPTFTEGYVMLSNAYIFSGRNEQAVALLEMLIEFLPDNVFLINNLAYVYVDSELDVERGLELIMVLNEWFGGEMPAGLTDTLAWALYKNGKIEEAEAAMRLTIARAAEENDEDESATMYYHYATILYASGKYAEAKEAITLALLEADATLEMVDLEKRIDAELAKITQ